MDHLENKTGIYKLGFNPWSFIGIALPLLFVIVVGGGLAYMVTR